MNRLIFAASILLFVGFTVVNCAPAAVKDTNKGQGQCTGWVFSECRNLTKGTCGRGTKKGTRSGPGCQSTEKTDSCKVACPADKKGCKYRKGNFGECDDLTSKRVRVDTLMTEMSDSTCEPTKKTEKTCKKKCVYGTWTETECKDGKMTKTRMIKSGGDECRRKASKTMKCGGGGGGGGGGKRRGGHGNHQQHSN